MAGELVAKLVGFLTGPHFPVRVPRGLPVRALVNGDELYVGLIDQTLHRGQLP